ncbi:MAG: desulfoferrodoxin [Peptococcaceae bacterium]|nr:desulfoferrodoxin [Peptococcaceae bacterium]
MIYIVIRFGERDGGLSIQPKTKTRSKNSIRPRFLSAEPVFYRCRQCGNLIIYSKKQVTSPQLVCCDQPMEELIPDMPGFPVQEHLPVITISGGFESNIITVNVGEIPHPMEENHHVEWIYLRTFQGGQLKYLEPGQKPETIFGLTEADAYVYCDRPVCKMGKAHCMFNCKRGFTAYAFCNLHGFSRFQM